MTNLSFIGALICGVAALPSSAQATCESGAYGSGRGDFVVLVSHADASQPGQRYLFLDGRRGSTHDRGAPATCADGAVAVSSAGKPNERWAKMPITSTDTTFSSVDTRMKGRLLEPAGGDSRTRPLVVMVHGSERTSAMFSPYSYALAAQGIAVFIYDKRGTGSSEGEYTQNFELLAADAAAALTHARAMARSRFGRSGYFGGSQGGWVAPLAATKSGADFVAVGFGLVASPIEEDRDQMISEARALKLDERAIELLNRLSQATARLLRSGFSEGYDELAQVRRELAPLPWSRTTRSTLNP